MMILLSFVSPILVSLAIFIISYLPGRIILDRCSFLNLREKFALSFLVSFLMIYIAGFYGYALTQNPKSAYRIIFVAILVGSIISFKRLRHILSDKTEGKFLLLALLMFFWLLAFHSLHRCYGGGGWTGDWYEHYERSLFLSVHYDRDYQFIDTYDFSARPPLFNLICAFFFSLFGSNFWVFQVTCSFLNMTLVFGGWILISRLFPSLEKTSFLVFLALFMINVPMVRQMIYTMTKGLAAAYVLAGTAVYLKGRISFDLRYLSFAFLLFSAGVLAHYSAAPFFLAIGLDLLFLFLVKPERKKFASLLVVILLSSALLLTWIIYSIDFYGIEKSFLSNTTYTESRNFTFLERISKDLYNLRTTFIPDIDNVGTLIDLPLSLKLMVLYDLVILFYSGSLIGNLSITFSLFLMVFFLKRLKYIIVSLKTKALDFVTLLFWFFFLGVGGALALVSNGGFMHFGTAHVSFVPIGALFLLLAWYAARRISKFSFRLLIALGVVIESFFALSLRIIVLSSIFINPTILYRSSNHYGNFAVRDRYDLEFLEGIYNGPFSYIILALVLAGWVIWTRVFIRDMLHPEEKENYL